MDQLGLTPFWSSQRRESFCQCHQVRVRILLPSRNSHHRRLFIRPVIKRIVFLSTATAITSTPRADKIFTEEDWNEVAVKPSEGLAKDVSKTLAEKGKLALHHM